MTRSAMSSALDLKLEPFSDCESDEWGLFLDEFNKGKVNGPSSKLTTGEIVKQTLHDIEDLGRKYDENWLDEFRLFEETQTLEAAEDFLQDYQLFEIKSDQHQNSPDDGSIVPENQNQPLNNQDLFPTSYEAATTFILSNEDVLYFNSEPSLAFSSHSECKQGEENEVNEETEELKEENTINLEQGRKHNSCQHSPISNEDNAAMKMKIIDEILWSKAQELDQWESYTYQSEKSSDSSSSSSSASTPKLSSEEKEDETDDPEWSPNSPVARKCRSRIPRFSRRENNLEDKKLRKKEQNKNAATRYRLKKKAEVLSILREEELLKEKKSKLEERVTDIQNEIRYLKSLMRELLKAKITERQCLKK